MKRKWFGTWGVLILLLLLLVQPVPGEEAGEIKPESEVKEEAAAKVEEEAKLPQIEVLAHKEKAATSTVVTKEDISIGPYMNLPGYLEEQSGVDMSRRSFLGVRSHQLSLRGFDESRYQVYLNGRTFKGAGVKGGFYVDWSTLTPQDLERLEIIRGGLSAEYGNTLGGVITINTQRGSKEPKIYLDSYWGSWDTQNYRLLHTGSKGPVEYVIGISYGNTEGYLRNNFVHDRVNFNTSLTYNTPFDLSLTGAVRYISQKNGWIVYNRPDSPYYNPDYPQSDSDGLYGPPVTYSGNPQNGFTFGDNSYSYTQRWEWDFEAKQKFWTGDATFRLFYFQATRNDFWYAMNNPSLLIGQRGSWDEDSWGWNFKIRQQPGKVRLGFGLEGNYFGYGGTDYSDLNAAYYATLPTASSGPRDAQKLHGGFVDAAMPFWKYFELYLGLRYDNYDAAPTVGATGNIVPTLRADALSPKSTLTIRPTDTTEGYLSVNFSTRFPTLPESYWFSAGYQPANRMGYLSPEFGMQYEAGILQQLPWSASLRLRTYYYDMNNYIRTVFGYRPSRVVYNIDLAKLRGVELEGLLPLPYNLTAFANYTWQQTSTSPDPLDADVRELVDLPDHKVNLGMRYRASNEAEAKVYLRIVSHTYQPQLTIKNQTITGISYLPLKGFATLNLEGRYPVMQYQGYKGFLYFGVDNLFSNHYQESYGYPMPTATVYGGIQLRY